MLLYEYAVRDKIDSLAAYARIIRAKFEAGTAASELLLDAEALKTQYAALQTALPADVRGNSSFGRHVGFMILHLGRGSVAACETDIRDICESDIPQIEKAFRKWCKKAEHYDTNLHDAISDLVVGQHHDSAIRKAFLVLTERLRSKYKMPGSIDGADLVNKIFAKNGPNGLTDDGERQAMRDLLAGLYGIYRNTHAHTNTNPSWAESDGIISMINLVLLDLDRLPHVA